MYKELLRDILTKIGIGENTITSNAYGLVSKVSRYFNNWEVISVEENEKYAILLFNKDNISVYAKYNWVKSDDNYHRVVSIDFASTIQELS